MKKILVTGGAGYIDSACSEYLLDPGYEATGKKINFEIAPGRAVDPARLIACGMLNWKPAYGSAMDIIESARKWQLKFSGGYAA